MPAEEIQFNRVGRRLQYFTRPRATKTQIAYGYAARRWIATKLYGMILVGPIYPPEVVASQLKEMARTQRRISASGG